MRRILCILLALLCVLPVLAEGPPVQDYKQADPRWADMTYSNHGDEKQTLKLGGCSVCALANVLSALVDDSITPTDVAQLSMEQGYVGDHGGTKRGFLSAVANFYPLSVKVSADIEDAITCLDSGGLVIAVVGKGLWNRSREVLHAITVWRITDENVDVCDSSVSDPLMSRIVSNAKREKLDACAVWYYCYWTL